MSADPFQGLEGERTSIMTSANNLLGSNRRGEGEEALLLPSTLADQMHPQYRFVDAGDFVDRITVRSSHRLSMRVADPSSSSSQPKPLLSTLQLAAVTFLISIGGSYGLEGCILYAGPLITTIFITVLPWLWCIPTTMCVAELACSIPSNGGPIMWVNVAYPVWVCFTVVMWSLMLQFVDNALYPNLAADYTQELFPAVTESTKMLIKGVFVCCCAMLNILGIEIVGFGSVALTFIITVPFLIMFIMFFTGSPDISPGEIRWTNMRYVPPTIDWASFLPLISWSVSGLDNAGNLVQEVQNPSKSILRALCVVIVLMILCYVPPVMVGVSVDAEPEWDSWEDGYWTTIAGKIGGKYLEWLVFVGGCASCTGFMMTNLCTTSRSLAAMGSIGIFPDKVGKFLGKYNERFKTPVNAILVNSAVLIFFALFMNFEELVSVDQILYSLRIMVIYGAVIILRVKYPTLPRPFKIPGGVKTLVSLLLFSFGYNIIVVVFSIGGKTSVLYTAGGTIGASILLALILVFGVRQTLNLRGRIEAVPSASTSTSKYLAT